MMNRATAVALATAFFVCTAGLTADHGQTIRKTAPGQAKKSEPPVPFAGVSLKIADEKVPPGGIAQVKLFVTEPRPISTAGGKFALDGFDAIEGVALMSPGGDAMGVGRVDLASRGDEHGMRAGARDDPGRAGGHQR